ncbi:hypothetical protein WJX73_004456 [Symbiochloris irregularis]|uniref:Purple acid phosphatase n=1 Tax=Symbiochloris irregularis TaxID=706552 RepID=A0AAW1PQG9_9CHLO
MRPWTVNLPLEDDYYSPGSNAALDEPTQIHLSIAGPNAFYVSWATGNYSENELTPSYVHYGTSEGSLDIIINGTAEVYNQIYTANQSLLNMTNALNYSSPVLHTVVLEDLEPNTTYYYQVGDGTTFSETYSFRSLSGPHEGQDPAAYPQRLTFIADVGYSYNTSSTLEHVLESQLNTPNPPIIFLVGDYAYADGWEANGTETATNQKSANGLEGKESSTWQPVWDAFMRFLEPLVAKVPLIGVPGNHEVPNNSGNYQFHSSDFGPVHAVFLSVYADYTPGSPQWQWLYEDLSQVNRTTTPWIILNFHNPWYTTDGYSWKQYDQMRVSMEEMTHQFGVDAFFYGHVHSYERTAPVYDFEVDPCGSVHITIGDAGNSEGLSDLSGDNLFQDTTLAWVDYPGNCPNVSSLSVPGWNVFTKGNTTWPFGYYEQVLTFQGGGNSTGPPGKYPRGFCPDSQPLWSQYRENAFGHGVLDIVNSTHALWQWHRNQDSEKVVSDQVYLVRNTTLCPNKLGNSAYQYGTSGQAGLNIEQGTTQAAGR